MSQEIFADIMYVNVCMNRGQHCETGEHGGR